MAQPNQQQIEELAQRHGVSSDAVTELSRAIQAGGGTMAQFSHPDLGGPGQWSHGGMTMIGDMFNDTLKAKVSGLCSELASLLSQDVPAEQTETTSRSAQSQTARMIPEASLHVPATNPSSNAWWGADLGSAGSTGSQNHIRYAYFPATRRLAIKIGADVTIYDTADHEIGGVSQQQSGDASLTFVSQHGLVRVSDLRVV
jgi:hypothetical protein